MVWVLAPFPKTLRSLTISQKWQFFQSEIYGIILILYHFSCTDDISRWSEFCGYRFWFRIKNLLDFPQISGNLPYKNLTREIGCYIILLSSETSLQRSWGGRGGEGRRRRTCIKIRTFPWCMSWLLRTYSPF